MYPYHDPNTATNIGKYYYDGNGTRVIKKNHIINSDNEIIDNTILYVHDQAGNVIQEYNVFKNGDIIESKVKDYMYFNGNLIASADVDTTEPQATLIPDLYVPLSTSQAITFKWSAQEKESTLLSVKYGLHKCINGCTSTEGCEPNDGGLDYIVEPLVPPQYSHPLTNAYFEKELHDNEHYRISFQVMNEAKQTTTICSDIITADLNPPVVNSIDDPGDCWPHLDNVVFDWSGEDSVGIKEAYYAIGPDLQHPTDTRNWTLIDPISFHVIAENLDLAPYTPYYVSIKLVDHVGHEVTQTSSHGFRTGMEHNAISNYDNISTIINSSQTIHITFINDCAVENWEPGSTYLSVKALNLDDEFNIQLEETIEPGQQYDFEFTFPAEWISVPRLLKLDIQMMENGEPFGQKVHREILVSLYMKIASWKILSLNGFSDKVYLSAFYKSTRSDTDIGVVAKKCNPDASFPISPWGIL